MNTNDPNYVSDAMIYRLVDGALEEREYQTVLRSLAKSPDGWRRCSLAFLEAQALKKELSDVDFTAVDAELDESSLPLSADDSGLHRMWNVLMSAEQCELENANSGEFASPVSQSRLDKREKRRYLGAWRQLGSRLFVGTSALVLCGLLAMRFFPSNEFEPSARTTPVTNNRLVTTDVAVRNPGVSQAADPMADLEFLDSLTSPYDLRVMDSSMDISRTRYGSTSYEAQVNRLDLAPNDLYRFR